MKWYSEQELADILDIKPKTVREYRKGYMKKYEGIKKIEGKYHYSEETVKNILLDRGKTKASIGRPKRKKRTHCKNCNTRLNKCMEQIFYCIQCDKYFKWEKQ